MQQLQLNIIPFAPPAKVKTFSFYKEWFAGAYAVFISEELLPLVKHFHQPDPLKSEQSWLYSDFKQLRDNGIELEIDLEVHLQFAEHYYRFLISNYFRDIAPIMRRNFTHEVELWMLDTTLHDDEYNQYYKFTLAVQHSFSKTPELIISYDGNSRVLKKSMAELTGVDTLIYRWMNYKGWLYHWQSEHFPADALQNQNEVFPVVSNQLGTELEIVFPKSEKNNRYPFYHKLITGFYSKYLNTEDFLKVIPLSPKGFITRSEGGFSRIDTNASLLEYGKEGTGTEPHGDIKKNGPYKTIEKPYNVKLLFVYQKSDEKIVDTLKKYLDEGYNGALSLNEYVKIPYSYKNEWNIAFDNLHSAVKTIYQALDNRKKETYVKYMIIYLSPVSKDFATPDEKKIYIRLKEMFLFYGYHSQVIYKGKVTRTDFNYALPNIQIAMLAKLGGVPWRLKRNPATELIIGIGASYIRYANIKMLGSAFCFDNDGKFLNFDCFPAKDVEALSVSTRLALLDFRKKNPEAKRMIIHFYKLMNKKELNLVLNMLYELKVDIPVIILTINKAVSKNILAFDIAAPKTLMPITGTYVQIAERQYLLYNNTRYNNSSFVKESKYQFPVKIKMTSTQLELLEDPELVDLLIDQVYQFSRMYWKSVAQQNMPVTILYPQMVAEIFPYFKTPVLHDFGKEHLWFL